MLLLRTFSLSSESCLELRFVFNSADAYQHCKPTLCHIVLLTYNNPTCFVLSIPKMNGRENILDWVQFYVQI